MMKARFIALSLLMIAAVIAATLYAWPQMPEVVAVHWNYRGEVDGYAPRAVLWLLGPGLMAFLLLLALLLPSLSPRRFEVQPFAPTFYYSFVVVMGLLAYVHGLVLASAMGMEVPIARAVPAGLLVMLILAGNPMGKVRRNFYLGIRTPWTLASERVWYVTHRLAARLMVGSGLLGLVALALGAPAWLLLVLALAWVPLAILYSLLQYKRLDKDQLEIH
ncbi:SdpI family protein [Janthinobacterium sp. 75]|uniref:SdpI family protein n=1 Tax=Janthinobacterium sp. 75 TaxID=2135628 RepID=UPI001FBB4B67|nr:SdpI family protein [Janthinobacterium sp. 75]